MTSKSMRQLNCRPVWLNVKLRGEPFLLSLLPDDIWKDESANCERKPKTRSPKTTAKLIHNRIITECERDNSATKPFLISSRNAPCHRSVARRHKERLCSRLWEKRLGQKGIFINGQCVKKKKVNWGHENLSNRNENLAHSLRGRRKQFGRARQRATRARSTSTWNPPPPHPHLSL